MTVRDLWNVLTFQVNWMDTNLFLVFIAAYIWLIVAGLVIFFSNPELDRILGEDIPKDIRIGIKYIALAIIVVFGVWFTWVD